MITNEDAELAKAIEQSLKDNATGPGLYEPLNPEQRKREDGEPCGLQNIGNSKIMVLIECSMLFQQFVVGLLYYTRFG